MWFHIRHITYSPKKNCINHIAKKKNYYVLANGIVNTNFCNFHLYLRDLIRVTLCKKLKIRIYTAMITTNVTITTFIFILKTSKSKE